jgi:hypothetical protein
LLFRKEWLDFRRILFCILMLHACYTWIVKYSHSREMRHSFVTNWLRYWLDTDGTWWTQVVSPENRTLADIRLLEPIPK